MEQMDFEQFKEYVRGNLPTVLPESFHNASIIYDVIHKPGFSYQGMRVSREGQKYGIVVDLDYYFKVYNRPTPITDIMAAIASMITERIPDIDLSLVTDYSWVKTRLFIRVFNRTWCRDYLSQIPYRAVEDLAVTAHLLAAENNGQISSTPVTHQLLASYGITPEQLLLDAAENGMKLFPPHLHYLSDLMEVDHDSRAERVLSNRIGINGAAALFYPGEMDKLAEEVGGDYYVVPTSVHEMIISPVNAGVNEEQMADALQAVMRNVTEERDWLADHVYYYDSVRRLFVAIMPDAFEQHLAA